MSPESVTTARRFVLGRQGLWPGRRWEGRTGLDRALRYVRAVQFDPLDVVGRSHDLALWGRIVGYQPQHLEDALYRRRTLFESGGNVQIRPIEERPYLRVVRERKVQTKRWRQFARGRARLLARTLLEIENRGPLGPGDFSGAKERRIVNYRASNESGLALYYLWLRGDTMIAFRRRGEKVFDLTSRLLRRREPEVSVSEAEEHLILGTLRDLGLPTGPEWLAHAHARIGRASLRAEWADRVRRWSERGAIEEVAVDGWPGRRWVVADGSPDLASVREGTVPTAWRPCSASSDEEAVFLAPLETCTASGRAKRLFDCDYLWEVYKPASARRWGYYTLPVLFGEGLVAKIEMRHDQETGTLQVIGFWPESAAVVRNPDFANGLARGLARLAAFRGATRIVTDGLGSPALRRRVDPAVQRFRKDDTARAGC